MSDLGTAARLRQATSQFPAAWYCDPRVLEAERRHLLAQAPGYVGHTLMIPEPGDYHVLAGRDNAQALVHGPQGIELLSNICRHRQAIMLNGKGNTPNIVCPIHRWTYDLQGKLLGAPHFANQPCEHLGRTPMQNWKGLLFDGPRDVARDLERLTLGDMDFSGYALNHVELHECRYNWKTFIEVYLEDYHVEPYHPGLGNFVNTNELRWEFGEWYNVQTVGVSHGLARPGTSVYAKWQEQLLRQTSGAVPQQGAIWILYYPNVMLEWYPHVLVISTLHPTGPEKHLNVVEFYYPEEIALFEPDFMAAQ